MYDRLSQSLVMGIRRGGELQKFPLHGRFNEPEKVKACSSFLSSAGPKQCHFCELKSELMEVHHLDHDHGNWARSNLVWACPLCHQVFHSYEAGLMGSRLIFAPDIKQQTLNHLQRMIAVVLYHGESIGLKDQQPRAKRLLNMLAQYSNTVQKQWTSYKLVDFALKLQRLTNDQYKHRDEALDGLRVLFNPEIFKNESVFWAKESADLMPANQWRDAYEDIVIQAGLKTLKNPPPKEMLRQTVDIREEGDEAEESIVVEEDKD